MLLPRRLILISGPQSWGTQLVDELIETSFLDSDRVYRPEAEDNSVSLLGQDRAMVVVDTYAGLNPDMLGRVSGLVQRGGALVLICPGLEDWSNFPDPELRKFSPYPTAYEGLNSLYLRRWVRVLKSLKDVEHYTPDNCSDIPVIQAKAFDYALSEPCTPDQQRAVEAVCETTKGQGRRPALIRADRGRGKSAALGLAAGKLIAAQQAQNIIVTAGGFKQAGNVFKHAHAVLEDASMRVSEKQLVHPLGTLRYISADRLMDKKLECDLLIVDEASALGVARLEALLKTYPRIAFSGTEYGYEGSGRGFSLKFRQMINNASREQNEVTLNAPIRWAEDDPLEAWINRLLLLDTIQARPAPLADFQIDDLKFRAIEPTALVENEKLLKQVFRLLVDAHYQTRPVDTRFLLDAPNSRLYSARVGDQIVGLIWLMHEGGLPANIARDIVAGRRRPQGHIVPQILAAHLGLDNAVTMNCARIQRIVVRPDAQRQEIGSWMLAQLEWQLSREVDYLAVSYGVDLPLSVFWHRAGFSTVRMSDKTRPASGLHSAVMLKSFSNPSRLLLTEAQALFTVQFIAQLSASLKYLPFQLVRQLAIQGSSQAQLDTSEIKAAVLFAYAKKPYESTLAILKKIAVNMLHDTSQDVDPEDRSQQLLITRVIQGQSWAACADQSGLSGKKECVTVLRLAVQQALMRFYPEDEIAQWRQWYEC